MVRENKKKLREKKTNTKIPKNKKIKDDSSESSIEDQHLIAYLLKEGLENHIDRKQKELDERKKKCEIPQKRGRGRPKKTEEEKKKRVLQSYEEKKEIIKERQSRYKDIARKIIEDPFLSIFCELWDNDRIEEITYISNGTPYVLIHDKLIKIKDVSHDLRKEKVSKINEQRNISIIKKFMNLE